MGLVDYLKTHIEFCKNNDGYKCGVFVSSLEKRKIVMDTISAILPVPNHSVELRVSANEATARFNNGSVIRIIRISESARGLKLNGGIVDSEIDEKLFDMIIAPCMRPLDSKWRPLSQVFLSKITYDDVNEAKSKYGYENIRNYMRDSIEKYVHKEFEMMFDIYDRPIIDKEIDGKRYLLYEAWGIPKSAIIHETEFVNKTKDMYLNVNGKAEDVYLGFENDINIHLPINTDVYDSFEVSVEDGMVRVVLHEIENEKPVLKDLSIG